MTKEKETKPVTETNNDIVKKKIETTIKSRGGMVNRVERYGDYYIKRWSEALGVTIELSPDAISKGKTLADALTYSNYIDLASARQAIDKADAFKDTKKHARDSETLMLVDPHGTVHEAAPKPTKKDAGEPVVVYDARGSAFSNANYEGNV
jgi:hypothetical protein